MLDISINEAPQNKENAVDIVAAASEKPATILNPKLVRDRAERYSFALGEDSPGPDVVEGMLQSPGGEEQLRVTAAQTEQRKRMLAAQEIFKTNLYLSPEDYQRIAYAASQPLYEDLSIENAYASKAMALAIASVEDPEVINSEYAQAPEISDTLMQSYKEEIVKYEGFRKLSEDNREQISGMGWGSYLYQTAKQFIPLYTWSTQINDTLGEQMSSYLPGANKQEQYQFLWSQKPEKALNLARQVYAELQETNPLEAQAWLEGLLNYSSSAAGTDTLFGLIDAATLTPAGLAKNVGKKVAISSAKKAELKVARDFVKQNIKDERIVVNRFGATKGQITEINRLNEKMRRTTAAVSQPNAKVADILSATGDVERGAKIAAREMAEKLSPNAAKSEQEDIARLVGITPSLFDAEWFKITASQFKNVRAARIAEAFVKNRELFIDAVSKTLNISRLPGEIEAKALDLAEESIRNVFDKTPDAVIHVKKYGYDQNPLTNTAYIEASLGRKDGTLFSSAQEADAFANKRYNLAKGTYDITLEGDRYAIRVRKDISETDTVIKDALITLDNQSNTDGILPFGKLVKGAKELFSPHQTKQRETLTHAQTALQAYFRAMVEPMSRLSKEERQALGKIMQINRDTMRVPGDPTTRGMFYNNLFELEDAYVTHLKRLPTDDEVQAYATFIQQSDMDYVFRSVREYTQKVREGVEKMETRIAGKNFTFEGKFVDTPPFGTRYDGGVYYASDARTAGKYIRLNDMRQTKELSKALKEGRVRVVQTFDPTDVTLHENLGVNGPVNFIIAPNIKNGPLRVSEQLPYRPGFHVRYADPLMIKQGRMYRDSSGRLVYGGDKAFLGTSNEAKGREELLLLERARKAILAKDDAALQAALDAGLPFTKARIKALFKDEYDVKTPFALVRSGQATTDTQAIYDGFKSLESAVGRYEDFHNSPYNISNKVKNEFTGEKNAPLWSIKKDPNTAKFTLEDAKTLDPISTQVEAMGRLIRSRHYNDYQLTAAESFAEEFSDLIRFGGTAVQQSELRRNPLFYLMHGTLEGPTGQRLSTAKNARSAIINLVSHNSLIGKHLAHFQSKLLSATYKRWGEKYVDIVDNWSAILRTDLPTKARAVAFHSKLGLFNPVQIAVQGQTLFNVSAISPQYGPGGTMVAAWMRRMDLLPGDAKMLDHMAKSAAKITPGWSADEFKESYNLLKQTGFDIVGREVSWRNDISDYKIFRGKAARMLDWSTMFFTGTERFVRLAAWNTAYKEYLDKFPALAGKLTPSDAKTILSRANDLSANMTRASHAGWQEGYASTITQFWGYTARMFDLLTGKRLTTAEKARLITMWSALYGVPVAATPLLPIWNWSDEVRGMLMNSGYDTNEGMLDIALNGVLSSAISGITDQQLDIGGRYGPGSVPILWELSSSRYGVTGFDQIIKIAGGASGSIAGQIFSDTVPVFKDLSGFITGDARKDATLPDLITALQNISSINNFQKMWVGLQYGVNATKDGRIIEDGVTSWEAVMRFVTGLEGQEVKDSFLRFMETDQIRQTKQEIGKEAKRYLRMYFKAIEEGDTERARSYMSIATSLTTSSWFDENDRERLLESVQDEETYLDTSIKQYITQFPEDKQDRMKDILQKEINEE